MTTATPDNSVPPGQLIKASLPAAMLGLLLAVALKFTALPLGMRVGMSVFTFIIAQAVFLQWFTGRRGPSSYWATVLLLALAAAAGTWLVAEL